MKVGDITEVMATTRGYQILKLESRSETKIRSLDEARGDVSQKVAEQKCRGETHEVSREAAIAGQDHLAERGAEEGVRESAGAAPRERGARAAPPPKS